MKGAIAALVALTALRLALAATLPLTPDEAYYFTWSQHLQAGYLDHPPMVALWIKTGTALCGNTPLGIRLLGPLAAALGSLALYDAGNRLLPGQRFGLLAAGLLNATPMLGAGSILMTPDTPLLFFWTLGVWGLARLVESANPRWWLVAGGIAGLMLLAKYTAVLFLAGAGLWAIFSPAIRPQLRTVWPWAGIALALALFSPNFAWNAAHGWASYLKQGSRENGFDPARALQFFGELVGGQFLLFSPLIAILAARGVWHLRGDTAPGARLLLWLSLLPAAIFLEHVLKGRVQGNWVAILYPAACLAAAAVPPRRARPALVLGFGLTALLYAQVLTGFAPIPARRDTSALQMAGWQNFAAQAAATHPAFITSDDYATAAELAFYAPKNVPVLGFGYRWKYFNWPVVAQDKTGLLITRRTGISCPDEVGTITRKRGNEPVMSYRVCRIAAQTPARVFPRP